MNPSFQPDSLALEVYDSLTGNLIDECKLPWVEDIFFPGHPCHEAYAQMLCAYEHLCSRLGSANEDPDGEIMIQSLLTYSRIIALEMFRYGQIYGKRTE